MANVGSNRVERVVKAWGNIRLGMMGTVMDRDVDGDGKKMRVLFDGYKSPLSDGTVIVLSKTMRYIETQLITTRNLTKAIDDLIAERLITTDPKAPIRSDPFAGAKQHQVMVSTRRVSATEAVSKPPVKTPSVEHVDLTVPFHLQQPARVPDYVHMGDYQDTDEIEGLVGEGYNEDEGYDLAQRIDRRLTQASEQRPEPSLRVQIRPGQPFTPWEKVMRTRRFNPRDMVPIEADECFRERAEVLTTAMAATFAQPKLPNK